MLQKHQNAVNDLVVFVLSQWQCNQGAFLDNLIVVTKWITRENE